MIKSADIAGTQPADFATDALPTGGLMVVWGEAGYIPQPSEMRLHGFAGRSAEMISPEEIPLLLLDIAKLGRDIPAAIARARRKGGAARLVVFADPGDVAAMLTCFEAGVDGCVLKTTTPAQVARYLDLVRLGERVFPSTLASRLARGPLPARQNAAAVSPEEARLSRRELEILRHLAEGASNKTIAQDLDVSEATVKIHVKSIHRKLQVDNRTQAALWAVTNGFPQPARKPRDA